MPPALRGYGGNALYPSTKSPSFQHWIVHEHRVADCCRSEVRLSVYLFFDPASPFRALRLSSSNSLSGSMEPAFYCGDLPFLVNPPNTRYQVGDITVYKIPGQDIPIVHRVLETHNVAKAVNGCVFI